MEKEKELIDQKLDDVSGGSTGIEKYLGFIKDKELKERLLKDYDGGKKLILDDKIPFDDENNVYVIKRERKSEEVLEPVLPEDVI